MTKNHFMMGSKPIWGDCATDYMQTFCQNVGMFCLVQFQKYTCSDTEQWKRSNYFQEMNIRN